MNFTFNEYLIPYLPEWAMQNQWWILFVWGVVLPLAAVAFFVWSDRSYHNDMLKCGSDQLELKRKYKKSQRQVHILALLAWGVSMMNIWGHVELPKIEPLFGALILLSLIFLPIIDAYTTHKTIGVNYHKEANPIGRWIMKKWGAKGSYIQVIFVWLLLCVLYYYTATNEGLSLLLTIATFYIGLFLLNLQTSILFKKYPDLYWNTEWYDGKKIVKE